MKGSVTVWTNLAEKRQTDFENLVIKLSTHEIIHFDNDKYCIFRTIKYYSLKFNNISNICRPLLYFPQSFIKLFFNGTKISLKSKKCRQNSKSKQRANFLQRRFITDLRKKREFCRIRISKFEKLCIIFQWTHKNVSDKGKRYFFSLKGLIENCVCFYVIEKSHQDRSF